jgi:hypothetical protein
MQKLSISVQIVGHGATTYHIEVPADWTLDKVRGMLAEKYQNQFGAIAADDTLIFAAQLRDRHETLTDLGMTTGWNLFFVVPKPAHALELSIPGFYTEHLAPTQQPLLVGRSDVTLDQPLGLNLEPIIESRGGKVDRVSRRQAYLIFEEGRWFVTPHEAARTPVFVNDHQVVSGQQRVLQDGDRLAFGSINGSFVIEFNVHYTM